MTDTHDPDLSASDPEVAGLITAEGDRQREMVRLIASENYVSAAVLRGHRHGAHEQVLRGLRRQALLRGSAGHRPGRDARRRARQEPLRRRPRQRAALLRLARQPRGLPRVPPARRPGHGHGAADGRPPDARLERLRDRQVVPQRAVRRAQGDRPGRHGRGPRHRARRAAQADLLRRHGHPAHHRLPGVRRDRPRGRARSCAPTSPTSPGWSPAGPTRRRSATPT